MTTPTAESATQFYCFVHGWGAAACEKCPTDGLAMRSDTPGSFALLYVGHRTALIHRLKSAVDHLENGYDGRALMDLQKYAAPEIGAMREYLWGEWTAWRVVAGAAPEREDP